MEFNSTGIVVQPHPTIKKDIWNQFVCEFPRCSNQYKLPENQKDRYKFLSALMIANIFDTLTSWQQLKKLYDIYEFLGRIANDKDYPPLMQKHILNLMKSFNTLISNLQPFDSRKIENNYQHYQKIQIVQEYLQKQRKYIYSLLDHEQGINTLFRLSRGIALSLYLKPDYEKITPVSRFITSLTREEIIKKLSSDDLEINQKNHFILEDYEIVAISHLLSCPIHFFINYFEPKCNYLIKRRIHQQQSEEKTIAFLLDIQQTNFQVRILSSTQDIIYIQNIINQRKYLFQTNQPKAIVEYLQQIIESILNQATHDFSNLNKFWIVKMLQIIKLGEAQTLIANRQAIKISELFSRESYNLFQLLNLDPKMHQEFLINSEQNLKQTEELIENIIISQVTMIRDQITEIVNTQKRPQSISQNQIVSGDKVSVPRYLVNNSLFQQQNNQTPNYFQQQKKLNLAGRLIAKDLDNDLPENSDSSERDLRDRNIQASSIQNLPVTCKEYDTEDEIEFKRADDLQQSANKQIQKYDYNPSDEHALVRPPKYQTQENKQKNDVISQKVSASSYKQIQSEKKRQKSVENTDFEASLNLQNDYLVSSQNRASIMRAQSDLNVLKQSAKQRDSLDFEPKKQIINQVNKMSSSQIMRSSVKYEQKQIINELYQSHISEVMNESKSEISMIQKWFCPICFTETYQLDQIRNLHDDHQVCKSCLEDWIKVKFNSGQWNFKFFKCPIQLIEGETMKPCEHIIEQQEIKNALTPDEFSKLTERAMKHGIIDIICPNQSCQASIKGMPPQNQNGFLCPQCFHKICWVCKNSDHGDSKCPQRLDEIKVALQDERVSCCPGCLEIYMKNDGCEHVSCTNCLIEFCFACSAHRPPIIAHGAHFHRVGCQYRVPWWKDQYKKIENLDEEYLPDECEYCKRNQKPCPRPMSLADFKNLAHLNF
ncbi:unnamed protein product [Paramecium pentaurelia]|uniref:RBR-type E3 ubiquitin transferase n=1 Tax=Paramecium pentaurelia TaxID=43138 RepID=A0A8S1TGL0_9CILI|nr:unnamed protein product [Paramecium pentaurelia]